MNFIHTADIENLILAKAEIEADQIKNKIITKKRTLPEFIAYLTSETILYIIDQKILSFVYIRTSNNHYIFLINDQYTDDEKSKIEDFILKFNDKVNLKEWSQADIFVNNITEYFTTHNKYYTTLN